MLSPTSLQAQQLLAQAQRLHAAGETAAAHDIYQRLHRADPKNPRLLYLLGAAELGLGQTDEARAHLSAALKAAPNDVAALHDLALTFKRDGRFTDALQALSRAIAIRPDDHSLRAAKAGIHAMMGDHAAAAEILEPLLAASPPHIAAALAFARIAGPLKQRPRAVDHLRACLALPTLAPPLRADLLFNIGALLDAEADYDAAFDAFRQAHALRPRRFNAAAFAREIDQTLASWTRAAAPPKARLPAERAVFILGMPRSGTSLVEQVLSSHPAIFGAGELDDINRAAFAIAGRAPSGIIHLGSPAPLSRAVIDKTHRDYLSRQRRLSPTATRITDKMPANFLHLGLIAAALPGARIIHCTREPLDTCLSCYAQNFGDGHPYTHDLADLAAFYRGYRRLMTHWAATLDLSILDVSYEQLVADLEGVSRGMVDFLGLPWDPACVRFHESQRIVRTSSNEQVRRPLYSGSVGRWRRYERHLGPLIAALGTTPPTSPAAPPQISP